MQLHNYIDGSRGNQNSAMFYLSNDIYKDYADCCYYRK